MTLTSEKRKSIMFRPVVVLFVMSSLCLAILSGCSLILSERSLDARYRELPFDEVHWKAVGEMSREGRSSAENRRANMVGDLVEHYLRLGMTKNEIERLLGPCDHHALPERFQVDGSWFYDFAPDGFEDLFNWEDSGSHYLIINFDEDGKYTGYKIMMI
jgi:hypothetical protein